MEMNILPSSLDKKIFSLFFNFISSTFGFTIWHKRYETHCVFFTQELFQINPDKQKNVLHNLRTRRGLF